MNLEEQLTVIRDRTKYYGRDPILIRELNSALSYVWGRIYQVYPNLQVNFDLDGTFNVDTQDFDLGAEIRALGGEFYAHKMFYIMDPNQNKFLPVEFVDHNDPRFLEFEQSDAQVLNPVIACIVNFDQIRFSPTLPSGTQWRSDWIGKPPDLSLATNCLTRISIPEPLHQPMTDYATAQVFSILDDDRADTWERKAENKIMTAIHNIKMRQQQTPQRTARFPGSGNVTRQVGR